jgi:membrane protease YdiL (CAAX protease family)
MSNPRPEHNDFGDDYSYEVWPEQIHSEQPNSPPREAPAPVSPVEYIECWRCGKLVFQGMETCLYCRASISRSTSRGRAGPRRREEGGSSPVIKLISLFLIFLGISVVFGIVIRFGFDPTQFQGEQGVRRLLLIELAVEGLDTVLVVLGLFWIGRLARPPQYSLGVRVGAWSGAPSVLLILLAVNYAYTRLLRQLIQGPLLEDGLMAHKDLLWLVILTVCVQPAIVEELFFRYLALGSLRTVTGIHGAVVISSVMFGMAHIFNPLGIPYLILVGLALGYLRVGSGSIILPMLLHFGHNLAVLYFERLP